MRQKNFVICSPIFCIRHEIDRSWERHFPFIDISILSRDMYDQSLKLFEKARTVDFGQVEMSPYNFFVSGQKFTNFLC